MEAFYDVLGDNQKDLMNELCAYVEMRTSLKPVIMFSMPAFKITNDVVIAFDLTKTYLGIYTTDQRAILNAKPRFDTALFGVCTVKVDHQSRKSINIIKDICDEVIMKNMTFNTSTLIKALDDDNIRYRDLAYQNLLEILEENDIASLDFKFFLYHEKKDYVLKGMGMLLKVVAYDQNHLYDQYLIDYLKVLEYPLVTVVFEALFGLHTWIHHKPYLKQTIKTYLKGVDFTQFKPHQIEKIKIEIEKIKVV